MSKLGSFSSLPDGEMFSTIMQALGDLTLLAGSFGNLGQLAMADRLTGQLEVAFAPKYFNVFIAREFTTNGSAHLVFVEFHLLADNMLKREIPTSCI